LGELITKVTTLEHCNQRRKKVAVAGAGAGAVADYKLGAVADYKLGAVADAVVVAEAGAVVDYDWKNWMTQRVPGNEGTQSLLRIDNRLIRERLC